MAGEESRSTVGQAVDTMARMTRTDLPAAWDERTTAVTFLLYEGMAGSESCDRADAFQ
jgi:hypothetical protein